MVFGLGNKSFLTNPAHYATPSLDRGPPTSRGTAERTIKNYDYVIIGGGTAGSVLASRLTEDPTISVLVLEAGQDHRGILETRIPAAFGKLFHTDNDWNYRTTAQPFVANRELYWPRGKMIGGSSSMNAMMHHHCDAHDFNEWANEFGCKGWDYKSMQPYFRRSEKFTPNPNRRPVDVTHRGDAGLWETGYSYLSEIGDKGFIEGCKEVGIPYNSDINTPSGTLGVTTFQTFISPRGARSSAATAYLPQHVVNRSNLHIATGVMVTKILFDVTTGSEPIAIGAELQTKRDGQKYHVGARKEVLLCGGAINTPQTLMLSGIGSKEQLQKHHIPIIVENDIVGTHLKDHFCSSGLMGKTKPGVSLDFLYSDLRSLPHLARWLVTGGGPMTTNVGEAAAFIRTVDPPVRLPSTCKVQPKDYGSGEQGPDVEIIGAPLAFIDHGESRPPGNADVFSMVPIGLRPQSKGTIQIANRDPFEHPIINPNYLSEKNDRDVLLVGVRVCLEILRSKALEKYLEPVEVNDDPNSPWWPYSSSDIHAITDEQLLSWMPHTAFTLYHPIGTARMGPDKNKSVVDLQCKVHGTKGLRVIDASIFPEQVSGHPTAPIIAIAEKAAEQIRGVAINVQKAQL